MNSMSMSNWKSDQNNTHGTISAQNYASEMIIGGPLDIQWG